nr:PREDICTED: hyaluronidase-4-like [Lepisosteus oculatus]
MMTNVTSHATFQHTAPFSYILTCLWALILISSSFALKPAKLPLIGRKPFIAAWNAPFDLCTTKYNISVNLEMFHISGSPRASRRGQNVTIFYANRLGHYPFYTEEGLPVNGGLPQNCSLETHLQKADKDIKFYIPSENFSGLAIIDWEYWRPQWLRNWQKKDIYRRKSRDLISKGYINVTSQQIEYLAQARFERSAMAFMKRTIQLGIQTRPHGLWGYYLYPDCHNYNLLDNNYTGSCPVLESLRNDELFWLWNSSTALFPSIAIKKSHADSVSNLYFAQFRVLESLRIASMTSMDYDLPTFVYTRLGYRDEALSFLSTKDLIHTIGESAALGAAGFVIWGDVNLTSSRFQVVHSTSLHEAADQSSRSQKTLSLQGFIISGWHSEQELSDLRERFACHCYEDYDGDKCDALKQMDKPDSSITRPSASWCLVSVIFVYILNFVF